MSDRSPRYLIDTNWMIDYLSGVEAYRAKFRVSQFLPSTTTSLVDSARCGVASVVAAKDRGP